MSTLAEQIAREHHLATVVDEAGPVRLGCSCGLVSTGPERELHIATVTERAVVDRLEALARELDALTITHQAENYATVLRIKREGVMEAIRRLKGDADA